MTYMRDSEDQSLPTDDGQKTFDLNLWGDGVLTLGIPMFFETENGESYNSAGTLTANLSDLFEEYLNECEGLDEGAGLEPLAKLFREMADKYEAAAKDKQKGK